MIRLETESSRKFLIIGAILVVFTFVFVLMLPKRVIYTGSLGADAVAYSYEMPRGESVEAPFDLSNRDVIERSNGDPTAAPAAAAHAAPPTLVMGGKKAVDKAAEAKKKKAAEEKARREKAEKAKKQARAEARRNSMNVNMVDGRDRYARSFDPSQTQAGSPSVATYGGGAYAIPGSGDPGAETDPQKKEDEDNISASTWLSRLQTEPGAYIQKFMKVRNAGKINDSDFYRIVTVLLQDGSSDRQKAGLALLEADVSPKSYEFLILKSTSLSADVQAQMKKILSSYATPSKFFLLGRVLATSQNKSVLEQGLTQLNQVIANSKTPSSGQQSQSNGVSSALLVSFIGVVKKLSQNPDSTVANQAKGILSQLEAIAKI